MDNITVELLEKAKEAMLYAYAPYSEFKVGASLLTEDGHIFSGCNVENASYGATVCAERTAMLKAASEGYYRFERMAIVCSSGHFAYPCGMCRQVMAEFMKADAIIILEDYDKGILEISLGDILPYAFSGKDLENGK